MKPLRGLQFRWQVHIVLACILVCWFAFNAKLSQYESLHGPVSNISSNKIWSAAEKRTLPSGSLSEMPTVRTLPASAVFLLALIAFASLRRITSERVEEKQFPSPQIGIPGLTRFRGPPAVF